MAASAGFGVSSYLLGQKVCLTDSFCGCKPASVWRAISCFTGQFVMDASTVGKSSMRSKKRCSSAPVLGLQSSVSDEQIVSYDLWRKLPQSLSCLLELPDSSQTRGMPTKRLQERTAFSHFGVILEWKGIVLEDDDPELEARVWYLLSLVEEKAFPSDSLLNEIEGMKTEEAISNILRWSEDPEEIRRLAMLKQLVYQALHGRFYKLQPGVVDFLDTLVDFNIPIAIASDLPRKSIQEGITALGLHSYFDAIVAGEDFQRGKPESDMFKRASECIGIHPERCVVFGSTNLTSESARRAGMRSISVASRHPVYKLKAADHVVRWLDQLSIVDLRMIVNGEYSIHRGRWSDMEIVAEE